VCLNINLRRGVAVLLVVSVVAVAYREVQSEGDSNSDDGGIDLVGAHLWGVQGDGGFSGSPLSSLGIRGSVQPAPVPVGVVELPPAGEPEAEPDSSKVTDQAVAPVSDQFTDIAAAICSVWPVELCAKVLRVSACECRSGVCPFNGHIGALQIAPLHAWRFTRLGLDYYRDGADPYYNSAVAYWIYKDSLAATGNGWRPWPWCGLR
jgi:hypothetical protein